MPIRFRRRSMTSTVKYSSLPAGAASGRIPSTAGRIAASLASTFRIARYGRLSGTCPGRSEDSLERLRRLDGRRNLPLQSGAAESPFIGGVDLNEDLNSFNDRPAIANPNAPPRQWRSPFRCWDPWRVGLLTSTATLLIRRTPASLSTRESREPRRSATRCGPIGSTTLMHWRRQSPPAAV